MIRLFRIFILIALIVFLVNILMARPILRVIYPLKYQEVIGEQAQIYNLDPFMIAAIIQVESRWRPDADSRKGATGLMQLMPDTGTWVADQIDLEFEIKQLMDPDTNILLGTWYMSYLRNQFPSFVAALAAYNGGQGNVRKWLDTQRWDGRFETYRDIPFYETRNYVRKVVYTWHFYREIYDYKWDY